MLSFRSIACETWEPPNFFALEEALFYVMSLRMLSLRPIEENLSLLMDLSIDDLTVVLELLRYTLALLFHLLYDSLVLLLLYASLRFEESLRDE